MSRQPYMTFGRHLDKVSQSYWPGLFHCYDVPGLPRTNNALESHFRETGAACCGSRAKRALHSARCNAKARGNSSRAPQQRPRYSRPWGKLHLRIWRKNGSALLRIANGSACRADPCDRRKRNSINCVSHGRHYSLQAQGDFRGIASGVSYDRERCVSSLWSRALQVRRLYA